MIAWLDAWPGAAWLRGSATAYLFVNAAHILGIGILVGAVLPLDLRIAGLFRTVPLSIIGPFLSRVAGLGLALALTTGLWLFTVRPGAYLQNPAFVVKLGLLAAALANVLFFTRGRHGRAALTGGIVHGSVRLMAVASGTLWLGILLAGRWIGFV